MNQETRQRPFENSRLQSMESSMSLETRTKSFPITTTFRSTLTTPSILFNESEPTSISSIHSDMNITNESTLPHESEMAEGHGTQADFDKSMIYTSIILLILVIAGFIFACANSLVNKVKRQATAIKSLNQELNEIKGIK